MNKINSEFESLLILLKNIKRIVNIFLGIILFF